MGQETDDGGAALQLGLEFGNQRKGLGGGVVEVEDDEAWTIFFLAGCESGDGVLLVLDEGHLDSELARGLLNLRDKEEIFDKEEDLGGRVGWNGNSAALRVVDGLGVALVACTAMTVAAALVAAVVGVHRGGRGVGEVSVDSAIAVVHGADEAAWATLLLLAAFALETAAAVAWLMGVAVAVSAAVVVEAAIASAGDVAGILLGALTVAVAELLLPAFAATGGAVLLLAGTGLKALRLRCLGGG